MLWTIALVLAGVLVALLGYVAMQPSGFSIERSTTIAAKPEAAFAVVNDFRSWDDWSPWAKLDPAASAELSGAPSGAGARFRWAGNNKVGAGSMTIVESRPHDLIRIRLDFEKPMKATNEARFIFTPEAGGTRVSWRMTGENKFAGRLVCTFMNMDKHVGGQFAQGLAAMKVMVEHRA